MQLPSRTRVKKRKSSDSEASKKKKTALGGKMDRRGKKIMAGAVTNPRKMMMSKERISPSLKTCWKEKGKMLGWNVENTGNAHQEDGRVGSSGTSIQPPQAGKFTNATLPLWSKTSKQRDEKANPKRLQNCRGADETQTYKQTTEGASKHPERKTTMRSWIRIPEERQP